MNDKPVERSAQDLHGISQVVFSKENSKKCQAILPKMVHVFRYKIKVSVDFSTEYFLKIAE